MLTSFEIVVVGVSMGGFKALQTVLSALTPDFELPIVIVQHRNSQSGTPFARHLQKHCVLTVTEPDDTDPILPSRVYIAPAGYHLMVEKGRFSLSTDAPVCYATPSIDVLFESAAYSYGAHTIGVLLTGANDDGVRGLAKIKSFGGHVIAQDPATAECPIMPQAAITSGVVDKILSLTELTPYLASLSPFSRERMPTTPETPRLVNVLMVDDEPANLLALEAVLGDLNLNLIRAESGKEALRQVLKFDFAVILMDVRMPGMDGFEAASLIRTRAHSKETPIIFLTGLDPSQAQLFRGYEVGAVDYLVKPIVPEILRSKVSVFVDLHNKAREIKAQEKKYRAIFESFPDIYFSTDMQGRLTLVSPSVFNNLGYKEAELIGELITRLYYEPQDAEEVIDKIRSEGAVKDVEVCLMAKDGRRVEFSLTARIQAAEGNSSGGVEGVLHDITERKEVEQLRAEESLREQSKILQSVLDSMGDGVVVADTLGNFLLCNPAAEQITGSSPYGLTPEQWAEQYAAYRPDMVTPYPIHQRPLVRAMHGERIDGEEIFVRTPTHPGGIWLSVTGRPLKGADDKVRGGVAVFRDITETKRGEQRLTYLAQYDHLTGLPNRNLFRDRLSQAIARAERNQLLVALMFLDLDKFKHVNDTLGHAAGDQLLKAVAERLTRCVRHSDTVARIGGDEFTVILEGRSTVEHVDTIAQKILEAMVPHFTLGDQEVHMSCSIGIASAYGPGTQELGAPGKADGELLIKNADIAMYRAKELGRNNFQHYVPEMHTATMEKLVAGNKMRRALDKDELLLYYQPQIDVITRKIIGAEALLRWKPTGSDLLSPAEFMDLAEETGSIVSIGEWMLQSVCKQNKTWQEAGLPAIPIAINFSPQQLQQSNLIPLIRDVLGDTQLEAKYLDIEITEGQVMADVEAAIQTMSELKAMGVTISVDDFGTGYSSLNYLKHFPLDTLKLDQTFIRNLPDDAQDAAIASTIMVLAHSLNFRVIAEGVETEAQLNFLAERNCDGVQGALFSPPIPPKISHTFYMQNARN